MAVIQNMTSYDLKGTKLSFADWVSNISPTETPFCSMTGKEAVSQTKFQWQTDVLPTVKKTNAVAEGSKPEDDTILATVLKENFTQIFRRSVSVSDTANVVATYGRGKEVGYQMEKASLELKRDMEKAFLWQTTGQHHTGTDAGRTAGFLGLVAAKDSPDTDTGAIVNKETAANTGFTEADLFGLTYNLYLANSKANVIMFHPKHAAFFSGLTLNGNPAERMKVFGSMDDQFNAEVDTVVDPLGQRFALVPNRLMPENYLYFFNPADWTQMILRAPKKVELAKQGSSQEWMIEAEIGLRHRNPFASGILKIKTP